MSFGTLLLKAWARHFRILIVPAICSVLSEKYKTQEMYEQGVGVDPLLLPFVLYKYKTREMCERAVDFQLWFLAVVPDHLKMKKI